MTLRERIQSDLTAAMRSGDSLRRDVLRMAESALYNAEKAKRQTLSEEEVQAVVGREVKTRRESVDAFRKGGREELAAKEEAEIAVIEGFLPQQMDAAATEAAIRAAIAESGASSVKEMGRVMAVLRAKHAATMDLGKAGPLVKAALGG